MSEAPLDVAALLDLADRCESNDGSGTRGEWTVEHDDEGSIVAGLGRIVARLPYRDNPWDEADAAQVAALHNLAPDLAQALRQAAQEIETLRRERDAYRKAKSENDDRFMIERDTARQRVTELEALLATPCDTEIRWHNNGRGPRIVFEVGSDDYVVTADRAQALGAGLIRAARSASAATKGES